MARVETIFSSSSDETISIAIEFAKKLPENSVICFFGDLGAGKTTFIKGLAKAFNYKEAISSPTFVYLNIYSGTVNIYHFDLYRLSNYDEFLSMGFDEYFFAQGITCIEWSEKIESILPNNRYEIKISHINENQRKIEILKK